MVLCEEAARGNLSGFSPAAASDINLIDIALCFLATLYLNRLFRLHANLFNGPMRSYT